MEPRLPLMWTRRSGDKSYSTSSLGSVVAVAFFAIVDMFGARRAINFRVVD